MIIKLSNLEYETLKEAITHSKKKFLINFVFSNNFYRLEASEDTLIDLRDCCGDYLMYIGFNEGYSVNEKGKILEDLIDKLYIG